MSDPAPKLHQPIVIKEEPVEVVEAPNKNNRRCIRCKRFLREGLKHQCSQKFKCMKCTPERYRCKLCSYRGMLLVSYYKHVERFHNDKAAKIFDIQNQLKLYCCDWCTFKTYSQFMYISHIKRCTHYKPVKKEKESKRKPKHMCFKCEDCSYQSKTLAAFRYHKKNDECRYVPLTNGIFQCKLCLYSTKIPQAFRNHVELTHMLKGWFKCDWCDFRAMRVVELTEHMVTHIETQQVKRFKCDLCPFEIGDKYGLKQHVMRIHIAPKNMKRRICRICKWEELKITYKRKSWVLCECIPNS